MNWDLNKGEILKLTKWFEWLKTDIFHERRHTRSFLQSFKWFKAILTSYHISHRLPTNQIMDWVLDKGEILKTYKNEFDCLKRFFSWKKAYAIIFTKFQVISSYFDKYHISHRLPHKPNHGLGLRQGWNSENLQKWVWMLKTIFSWKKAYAIFFEKFQVISSHLTSYHISHQTSPQTKSWIGT